MKEIINKNKNVNIEDVDNNTVITALQENSTPGVYIYKRNILNTVYTVNYSISCESNFSIIICNKVNCKDIIKRINCDRNTIHDNKISFVANSNFYTYVLFTGTDKLNKRMTILKLDITKEKDYKNFEIAPAATIALTVALPMYRAKESCWLALESLVRQRDINFNWELIIAEENNSCNSGYTGIDNIKPYFERLKQVGCVMVKYKSLSSWIPLSAKWLSLADMADNESKSFLLQASDCYNQPYRLVETHNCINSGNDWTFYRCGIFYNIYDGLTYIYEQKSRKFGLSMAVKTQLIKSINLHDTKFPKKGIDKWIYCNLKKIKPKLLVKDIESEHCYESLDTNGLNTISRKRGGIMKANLIAFRNCNIDVTKKIPKDILERLERYKGKTFNFIT